MYTSDLDRFTAILRELSEVFGKRLDDLIPRRYFEVLKDVDFPEFERLAREHMREGKYFPKPRDLRPKRQRAAADSDDRGGKYPDLYTPAWHAEREEIMRKIAEQSKSRGVVFTDAQRATSNLALAVAMYGANHPLVSEHIRAYERAATFAHVVY